MSWAHSGKNFSLPNLADNSPYPPHWEYVITSWVAEAEKNDVLRFQLWRRKSAKVLFLLTWPPRNFSTCSSFRSFLLPRVEPPCSYRCDGWCLNHALLVSSCRKKEKLLPGLNGKGIVENGTTTRIASSKDDPLPDATRREKRKDDTKLGKVLISFTNICQQQTVVKFVLKALPFTSSLLSKQAILPCDDNHRTLYCRLIFNVRIMLESFL